MSTNGPRPSSSIDAQHPALRSTTSTDNGGPLSSIESASPDHYLRLVNEDVAKASPECSDRPKVLLATAGAAGTIAAVRELDRRGFDVGVVCSDRLGCAARSNRASRSYSASLEREADRFLKRLLDIGAAEPGQILLPTSDQTSWLYTVHASLLQQHFRLYQPSTETMRLVLDKQLFADAVVQAGLSVLPSWEPRDMDELRRSAPTLPYPVLIKPRTHVHRLRNDKGRVARSAAELIELYQQYVHLESVRAAENPLLPRAALPLLQQFVDVSKEGVYSVTGFISRNREHFVTRVGLKVFQRSQPVGVGICFESRPAAPALSAAVRQLCLALNYFGMFEVEFIRFGDSWAAIDFNPRLFNQVGMDIYRGVPLPFFACLDALDDSRRLRAAIAQAMAADEDATAVFVDRFTMRAILLAKTLTRRISRNERASWRDWWRTHADHAVDFAFDRKDIFPGLVHAASEVGLGLRAFPKFLRLTPRADLKNHRAMGTGMS